jgi:hypothetical protein
MRYILKDEFFSVFFVGSTLTAVVISQVWHQKPLAPPLHFFAQVLLCLSVCLCFDIFISVDLLVFFVLDRFSLYFSACQFGYLSVFLAASAFLSFWFFLSQICVSNLK